MPLRCGRVLSVVVPPFETPEPTLLSEVHAARTSSMPSDQLTYLPTTHLSAPVERVRCSSCRHQGSRGGVREQ